MGIRGKAVGGLSVRAEVTRVDGPRGQGAPALYAFGYADFAELVGASPWEVAEVVVDGLFEPLSLVELAIARAHGLAELKRIAQEEPDLAEDLWKLRPDRITEVAKAKVSETERPYGLQDLWAITYTDIADQTERGAQTVWNARKYVGLQITDLVSVVEYVTASLPARQRMRLGLV